MAGVHSGCHMMLSREHSRAQNNENLAKWNDNLKSLFVGSWEAFELRKELELNAAAVNVLLGGWKHVKLDPINW